MPTLKPIPDKLEHQFEYLWTIGITLRDPKVADSRSNSGAVSGVARRGTKPIIITRASTSAPLGKSRLVGLDILVDVLEILAVSPEDWRIWRRLRLGALAESPHAFAARLIDWQGENDVEERWRGRLTIPGSFNVIAMIDGQPIGMASAVPAIDDDVIEVWSMWVAPTARGRGAGDALLRELQRWGTGIGAHTMRLRVAETNDAASELYQRNGFRHTGELGDLMPDGVGRELVMAKQIQPSAACN